MCYIISAMNECRQRRQLCVQRRIDKGKLNRVYSSSVVMIVGGSEEEGGAVLTLPITAAAAHMTDSWR